MENTPLGRKGHINREKTLIVCRMHSTELQDSVHLGGGRIPDGYFNKSLPQTAAQ